MSIRQYCHHSNGIHMPCLSLQVESFSKDRSPEATADSACPAHDSQKYRSETLAPRFAMTQSVIEPFSYDELEEVEGGPICVEKLALSQHIDLQATLILLGQVQHTQYAPSFTLGNIPVFAQHPCLCALACIKSFKGRTARNPHSRGAQSP